LGRTHTDYARWLNLRRGETGHLWQNRYYSCPLDEPHQWEALRYVELNPVRAGLAADGASWRWSSASAHLTGVDQSGILDMMEWRGAWTAETWQMALEVGIGDAALAERIRDATRTGRPAGGAEFVKHWEQRLNRQLSPAKRGPTPKVSAEDAQMELGYGSLSPKYPTNPATPTSQLVAAPAQVSLPPSVTIGGADAPVQWAGLVSSGLYQLNVRIPNVAAGDQPIQTVAG
jgi:putative transposase